MGLDFGLETISKELWDSFGGDKKKYYEYFSWDNPHEDKINYLESWCGRGNPIAEWFREGLKYYKDYDGVLMRALTPEDLYNVIKVAKRWYDDYIDLKPVVMGRAFKEDDDNNLTMIKVDGIEVMDEDQAYHRFYAIDSDGRLFMTKRWVDIWDPYRFINFIDEIMNILLQMDWENNVLLYHVSY